MMILLNMYENSKPDFSLSNETDVVFPLGASKSSELKFKCRLADLLIRVITLYEIKRGDRRSGRSRKQKVQIHTCSNVHVTQPGPVYVERRGKGAVLRM